MTCNIIITLYQRILHSTCNFSAVLVDFTLHVSPLHVMPTKLLCVPKGLPHSIRGCFAPHTTATLHTDRLRLHATSYTLHTGVPMHHINKLGQLDFDCVSPTLPSAEAPFYCSVYEPLKSLLRRLSNFQLRSRRRRTKPNPPQELWPVILPLSAHISLPSHLFTSSTTKQTQLQPSLSPRPFMAYEINEQLRLNNYFPLPDPYFTHY